MVGEHGRGDVPQRSMRPTIVVIILPYCGELSRRREALELLHSQKLIARSAVEALDVTVFPRAAWLDVERLDANLGEPLPQCWGDELGAVVAADAPRHAPHC